MRLMTIFGTHGAGHSGDLGAVAYLLVLSLLQGCVHDTTLARWESPSKRATVVALKRMRPNAPSYNPHVLVVLHDSDGQETVLLDIMLPDLANISEDPFIHIDWTEDGGAVVGVVCGKGIGTNIITHEIDGRGRGESDLYRELEDSVRTDYSGMTSNHMSAPLNWACGS